MPSDEQRYLGRAVASMRCERGMMRRDLADLSGLSYPFVAEIEHGRKTPSHDSMEKLAAAFATKPSELLARAEWIAKREREGWQ